MDESTIYIGGIIITGSLILFCLIIICIHIRGLNE